MPTLLPASGVKRGLVAAGVTLGLVLVLVLGPAAARSYAAGMFGTLRAPGEAAFTAGHRGDSASAPENTLPAIDAAFAAGLPFVEVDIRLSADGIPVLIHDASVDRTTNGTGDVAELTLAELQSLDAGSWFREDFAGTRIPTLQEFFAALAQSRTKALLEFKGVWGLESSALVGELIEEHGVADRTVAASFETETLHALLVAAPGLPRVKLSSQVPDDPIAELDELEAIGLVTRLDALLDTPDTVETLRAHGFAVLLYTLNDEEEWAQARALGVDGIVTDEPGARETWQAAMARGV